MQSPHIEGLVVDIPMLIIDVLVVFIIFESTPNLHVQ